jgi:16S rRNA (uracil1498-N3)-methyltransferase
MSKAEAKIRLYVAAPLALGQAFSTSQPQAHYLLNVMRQGKGDRIKVFNGRDGEWLCEISEARKKAVLLAPLAQQRPQGSVADVELLFAPIKRERTSFIVEKATELGVRRLMPVLTRYTNNDRIRIDKLEAHAIEAAEQCGGLDIPAIAAPVSFARLFQDWSGERALMFCDERMQAASAREVLQAAPRGPWSILIGPEGGFAPEEQDLLATLPNTYPVSLGNRILRADTASVAALALWHQTLGDWM